jgi:hypothetical protein
VFPARQDGGAGEWLINDSSDRVKPASCVVNTHDANWFENISTLVCDMILVADDPLIDDDERVVVYASHAALHIIVQR